MYKTPAFRFLLATVMAVATTVAFAAPHDGDGSSDGSSRHSDGVRGLGVSLTQLNLSDAQRANITQIIKASATQHAAQRQAVQTQRAAFDAMTPSDAGYQSAAASLAQAEANETQARIVQHAQVEAAIYAVLTPAQRALIATAKAQRQAREAAWQKIQAQYPADSVGQPGR
ncbi:MAG TPA: Spy/CpxP family protein refolding chaperone [Dyella sp.]|uniref:Spy/CpxP family protein refolding chaperone n=1 Tax=Dyella sp. TaxID=1869338 RepID=UPI002CE5CABE|nr:Spy/CpxP family protein refolding chaperone [Dyella sp.]HUB91849.1 Spy/CpxP family protein refolding chaperone [Dyella sp.]